MPELPEVETICRMLSQAIIGQVITNVKVVRRDLRWQIQDDFESMVQGQEVLSVSRRSKYILIELLDGFIIWHLGMSGTIQLISSLSLKKHDHVVLRLSSGNYIVYNDPRRFGSVFWARDWSLHARLKHLGPEPFSEELTAQGFFDLLQSRKKNIKETIMDAKMIVGVGNIYANESLFLAGLHPTMPANQIALEQAEVLLDKIRYVLAKAIEKGGTTLSDHKQLDGKPGYFQQELQVYGRAGQSCYVCDTVLEGLEKFSRQTVCCPNCQS